MDLITIEIAVDKNATIVDGGIKQAMKLAHGLEMKMLNAGETGTDSEVANIGERDQKAIAAPTSG
jgi:hypothetical protein